MVRSSGRSRPSSGDTVRVEAERLGGHPLEQARVEVDVERVLSAAPAPQGRAAGWYHGYRSGGERHVPVYPLISQVQRLRRPGDKEEPVVADGGLAEFGVGRRTEARRLEANPRQPVARRGRLEWDPLKPVEGPDGVVAFWLLLFHYLFPAIICPALAVRISARPGPVRRFAGRSESNPHTK